MGFFDIFKSKKPDLTDKKNRIKIMGFANDAEYNRIISKARKEADEWLERERPRLQKEAMERSKQFGNIHDSALSKININALKNISSITATNLTAIEILFLNYIDGKIASDPNIAGYWTHEYKLNYQKVLEKLFKSGYLTFSDYKFNMSKTKTDEIKKVLASHSLKLSGKKQDLIDRLIENVPEEELKKLFSSSYFMLTESGSALISKNAHIMYFHRHLNQFSIPVVEADSYKKLHPNCTEFEIALSMLNKRASKYLSSKDWGLYRNDLYALSIVYGDMNDYQNQLEHILKVCFIDLSGLGNGNTYNKNLSFLAPGIISNLISVQQSLGINDDTLSNVFLSSVEELKLPKHCYSKPKAFEYLLSEKNKLA